MFCSHVVASWSSPRCGELMKMSRPSRGQQPPSTGREGEAVPKMSGVLTLTLTHQILTVQVELFSYSIGVSFQSSHFTLTPPLPTAQYPTNFILSMQCQNLLSRDHRRFLIQVWTEVWCSLLLYLILDVVMILNTWMNELDYLNDGLALFSCLDKIWSLC